jgi:hypothetical protein
MHVCLALDELVAVRISQLKSESALHAEVA